MSKYLTPKIRDQCKFFTDKIVTALVLTCMLLEFLKIFIRFDFLFLFSAFDQHFIVKYFNTYKIFTFFDKRKCVIGELTNFRLNNLI